MWIKLKKWFLHIIRKNSEEPKLGFIQTWGKTDCVGFTPSKLLNFQNETTLMNKIIFQYN